MTDVCMTEVVRRYHIPQACQALKSDIDKQTESFLRDYMPVALRQAGIDTNQIVCIRELKCTFPFSTGVTESQRFEQWLGLLVNRISMLQINSKPEQWLHFHNPVIALISMAEALNKNSTRCAWAWYQLGFVKTADITIREGIAQWFDYLHTRPEIMFLVLTEIIRNGTLGQMLQQRHMDLEAFASLTDVACSQVAFELKIDEFEEAIKNTSQSGEEVDRAVNLPRYANELIQWVGRELDISSVLQIGPSNWRDEQRRRYLTFIKACVWPVLVSSHMSTNSGFLSRLSLVNAIRLSYQHLVLIGNDKAHRERETTHQRNYQLPEYCKPSASAVSLPADTPVAAAPQSHSIENDEPLAVTAMYGDFGGMVFLLNVLDASGAIAALHDELFESCSLPCLLESLCLLLEPQSDGDIAVDLVSGRLFEVATDRTDNLLNEEQEHRLCALALEIKNHVCQQLLLYCDESLTDKDALFAAMCRRRCRIEGESGWVNVYFEHESVTTEVRRAGLDLDPGFVPWLGYVVKFHYE